jgi:energy-coupling factor transporter ATP-binding protein EcfA2
MVVDPQYGTDASALLRGVLGAARARGFVGRAAEIASICESLVGASEVRVHVVHGPGGIGKTTLLDALGRVVARERGRSVYIDARDIECSMAGVTNAVDERSEAAGPAPDNAPDVLLIDGFELLEPLDRWFREDFLPSRPRGSVTVLSGRAAPHPEWRLDPGWRLLVRVHELGALGPTESRELLVGLGVPTAHLDDIARLGHGHPLVLTMLAEAVGKGSVPGQLDDAPDVVGMLCRMIIDDIPDAAHRAGLATCAHATRMTADLLSVTVGSRAGEVWNWLESRPYVRRGTVGLFLHDVVRELFEAEFAQRAPGSYIDLHNAVNGYFLGRLMNPSEPYPDRAAAELLLLHRRGPLLDDIRQLRDGGLQSVVHAAPGDREAILELISQGEGAESAELARRWVSAQPGALYRVRSDKGVEAFAMQVYLPIEGSLDVDDPVVIAVMDAVNRHGPLRPGERVNINRFSGASGSYQRDPLLLLANGVSSIFEWSRQPAAWTFIVTVDPEHYAPYFAYLGLSPMFSLDYFGMPLAGYGWDRRRFPVPRLFDMIARRELSGESGPPPAEMMRSAPLSRESFDRAVREALREIDRPDRLARSVLLGTGVADASATDPGAALREVLLATIDSLQYERRGAEHRRVLDRTFLRGTPSQEVAAELLGLPFSTYRRHLSHALERVVEMLWSVEIGGHRPADLVPPLPKVSSD